MQPEIPPGPAARDEPADPAPDPPASPLPNGSARSPSEPPAPLLANGPPWPAAWTAAAPPAGQEPLPAAPFPYLPARPPGPPPDGDGRYPGHDRTQTTRPARLWLVTAAALLGGAGLIFSLIGVASQVLPRRFTAAQQQQIMSWQVASRWRTWSAGEIFPATVGYQLPWSLLKDRNGLTVSARRVGIAPQTRCSAAVDPALARVLGKRGCEVVLRATYTDATESFVVTVAVVVMPGVAAAAGRLPEGHGLAPGVRPVPFPGTLAARFGRRQRQISGAVRDGPYLILYTAGYADGRQRERVSANPYADSEMKDVGSGIARNLGAALGAPPPAPRCPGAPGC
jgi:hypothetical protein